MTNLNLPLEGELGELAETINNQEREQWSVDLPPAGRIHSQTQCERYPLSSVQLALINRRQL